MKTEKQRKQYEVWLSMLKLTDAVNEKHGAHHHDLMYLATMPIWGKFYQKLFGWNPMTDIPDNVIPGDCDETSR